MTWVRFIPYSVQGCKCNGTPSYGIKFYLKKQTKIKSKRDAETLKTSNQSHKIICRPTQSRETIPLRRRKTGFLHYHATYCTLTEKRKPVQLGNKDCGKGNNVWGEGG